MSAYRSVPYLDTSYLRRDRAALEQLASEAGRDPSALVHSIQDHVYISMDGDARKIREVVERTTFRPFEGVEPYMMLGTPDEIVPRLQARYDAGIVEILINFIDPEPEQLELFAEHIAPRIRG
jgi:alkanesulfonate monooxygenase SsuD/methylene tetrahydromethanopterin reductase-like flavin-dependent oxidoreductase (luciferase family)